MPDTVLLPLLPGMLQANACFNSEQERLVGFAAALQAILNGQSFINVGSTLPDPENNGFPWLRTVDMELYEYVGVWRRPHGLVPSGIDRRFVEGSPAEIESYDGGAPGVVSPTSGPMWEIDTNYAGRLAMGAGAIPGADPAKTLTVGENYGAGSHAQTITEMPAHVHSVKYASSDVGEGMPAVTGTGGSESFQYSTESTGTGGVGTAFSIVPPVRGGHWIKRTARVYRTV